MNQINENAIETKIRESLAHYLGIEKDDLNDDDSLIHDLHMKPSDLSDFLETLQTNGVDTQDIDLTEIDTLGDLVESLVYDKIN